MRACNTSSRVKRVAPDDAARFANADLRAGRGDARVLESRHALAKELAASCIACRRASTSARVRSIGIERIDVDDARHVHRHLVGIGRDEKRDELRAECRRARRRALAPTARRDPATAVSACARAFVRFERGAHLIGVHAHVGREFCPDRRGSSETSSSPAARGRARRPVASERRPKRRRTRRRSRR